MACLEHWKRVPVMFKSDSPPLSSFTIFFFLSFTLSLCLHLYVLLFLNIQQFCAGCARERKFRWGYIFYSLPGRRYAATYASVVNANFVCTRRLRLSDKIPMVLPIYYFFFFFCFLQSHLQYYFIRMYIRMLLQLKETLSTIMQRRNKMRIKTSIGEHFLPNSHWCWRKFMILL